MSLGTTDQLISSGIIPHEIGKYLKKTCDYCGCPIINNYELTERYCANFNCYGHMQHRADDMCKKLGFKDIGPATCLSILKANHLGHHFEILPYICKDKPRVYLWQIAEMAGVPGVKSKWEDLLAGYKTFDEYFALASVPKDIIPFRSMLNNSLKYFDIIPPLSKRSIIVMITGSIRGFNNREDFIAMCNHAGGSILKIQLKGKRQSADYLITENKNTNTPKAQAARDNNIPIVSPTEFLLIFKELLRTIINKYNKEGS